MLEGMNIFTVSSSENVGVLSITFKLKYCKVSSYELPTNSPYTISVWFSEQTKLKDFICLFKGELATLHDVIKTITNTVNRFFIITDLL